MTSNFEYSFALVQNEMVSGSIFGTNNIDSSDFISQIYSINNDWQKALVESYNIQGDKYLLKGDI